MKRHLRTIAALVATASLVGACSGDDDSADPGGDTQQPNLELVSSLEQFDDCDAVRNWASEELAPRVGAYGFPGGVVPMEGDVVMDDATAAAEAGEAGGDASARSSSDADASFAPSAPGAAPSPESATADGTSHSTTNVQVEGVDEPDVVKTDGNRIVAVVDGKLHLVSAETSQLLDSVDLPEGMYDGEILMAGDRVLVFSSEAVYSILEDSDRAILPPDSAGTVVTQVDVVGDQLEVTDSLVLDGSYVSARMTDDAVRLVLHADPQAALPMVTPAGPSADAEQRAQELNQEVVSEAAAEDFLPRWRQVGPDGEVGEEGELVTCDQAHAPQTFAGFGMVTVVSIDVSDGIKTGIASANGAGVMAGGQTVYASAEHLYVAAPAWVDWESLSDEERVTVNENFGTDIHRFDITDPAKATYEMSGHVAGSLLNQFALDEYDGNLRVATTTGSPWAEDATESDNHVVVLAPGDGALTQIGGVSGLGRGESIYAVRFLGSLGYVVTFEQTDPLYTVDLTDPTKPTVAGELHIPGYSAYLHPVGDGRLIGVGQDATEGGSTLGTQVALFDVSDPAAPERVAQTTLPDASSGAEWDHHAFLWWPDESLLALPLSSYDYTSRDGGGSFEGLVGFDIDVEAATINERGRVSHPAIASPYDEEPIPIEPGAGGGTDPSEPSDIGFAPDTPYSYSPQILRSLVIGDQLWTLSSSGLMSSNLSSLAETTFVPFA